VAGRVPEANARARQVAGAFAFIIGNLEVSREDSFSAALVHL